MGGTLILISKRSDNARRVKIQALLRGHLDRNFVERKKESNARENKAALTQLISHTKNVERAVTMSQQDILAKKETQVQK